ncbi:MAG: hypothetical protein AW07_00350 [Candidatus Accumulibacter sp. SK-11]|nr:MAG: hypothetical protein AW07_00350 [Candidatus Accumulibacter sp. SK-11]
MKLSLNLTSPPCSVILAMLIGSVGFAATPTGADALPSPATTGCADGCAGGFALSSWRTICSRFSLPSRVMITRAKKSLNATSPITSESGFRRRSSLPRWSDFHFRKSAELILSTAWKSPTVTSPLKPPLRAAGSSPPVPVWRSCSTPSALTRPRVMSTLRCSVT